jgi:hypothetical protein
VAVQLAALSPPALSACVGTALDQQSPAIIRFAALHDLVVPYA